MLSDVKSMGRPHSINMRIKSFFNYTDKAIILMMHRVGKRDPNRIQANQNMLIEQDELSKFIEMSKKAGWSFISLDELVFEVNKGSVPNKALVLTFDDGYLDNYTEGYPLLKSYDIHFMVYLTTQFIESQPLPWWYKLELILNERTLLKTPNNIEFNLNGIEAKNSAFLRIRQGLMERGGGSLILHDWIEQLFEEENSQEITRLFMNWDEVSELAKNPLVGIGAHTVSHPSLAKVDDIKSKNEIKDSKLILESKIQKPLDHFAFPFGGARDVSAREFMYVKDCGFKSAVTTRHGPVGYGSKLDLLNLPRIFFKPGLSIDQIHSGLPLLPVKNFIKKVLGYGCTGYY